MILAFCFAACSKSAPTAIKDRPPNSVVLTWKAGTEKNLAGYKIHYGTEAGKYTETKDVGMTETPDNPQYMLTDLNPGKTYYFAVKAYNKAGKESEYSQEVSKTIAAGEKK
jgi:hypothetical protein